MTDNIKMTVVSCKGQWRCTLIVCLIFVSTCLKQQQHAFNMAIPGNIVQRPIAMLICEMIFRI
jgi:hypothetical protein